MTNVEKSDIYPHLSCVCYVENVSKSDKFYADLLQLHSFFAKSVLLKNLFGYNFCTFAWRKIEPKIVSVEKKMTNIRYVKEYLPWGTSWLFECGGEGGGGEGRFRRSGGRGGGWGV